MSLPAPALQFGRFRLRPADRVLSVDGERVALGGRAFDLLCVLAQRRNMVVSQRELIERVWPDMAVEPNNLQVQVWALRRVLGTHTIVTVARRGYRLAPEVHEVLDGDAFGTLLPRASLEPALGPVLTALEHHALVTVTGQPDDATLQHAAAAARRWAERQRCAVWHLDAAQVVDRRGAFEPLLRALARRSDVLVVSAGHAGAPTVQGVAERILSPGRGARVVVAARSALRLPREHVVAAAPDGHPARPAPAPNGLRKRLR